MGLAKRAFWSAPVRASIGLLAFAPLGSGLRQPAPAPVPIAATLIIWAKQPGTVTGASMTVWIDGKRVGTISNLQRQETLALGELTTGTHEFKLTGFTGHSVDAAGRTEKVFGEGSCFGQFVVQPFQTYYFVGVTTPNGTDLQCRIG